MGKESGVTEAKDYRALAKERTRAALAFTPRGDAQARLAAGANRLFAWRRVDRKYAARAVAWAREAIWAHALP